MKSRLTKKKKAEAPITKFLREQREKEYERAQKRTNKRK